MPRKESDEKWCRSMVENLRALAKLQPGSPEADLIMQQGIKLLAVDRSKRTSSDVAFGSTMEREMIPDGGGKRYRGKW